MLTADEIIDSISHQKAVESSSIYIESEGNDNEQSENSDILSEDEKDVMKRK